MTEWEFREAFVNELGRIASALEEIGKGMTTVEVGEALNGLANLQHLNCSDLHVTMEPIEEYEQ